MLGQEGHLMGAEFDRMVRGGFELDEMKAALGVTNHQVWNARHRPRFNPRRDQFRRVPLHCLLDLTIKAALSL